MSGFIQKSHFVGVLLHLFALLSFLPAVITQVWADSCLNYDEAIQSPSLGNPLAVITSPDGKHVYVSSVNVPFSLSTDHKGALFAFTRDLSTGDLTPLPGTQYDGVSGVDGIGTPNSIAFSPDGKYAYVASGFNIYGLPTGGYDAVAVFKRDDTTGALSFVEAKFNGDGNVVGLANVSSVAVSPDGQHVFMWAQATIYRGALLQQTMPLPFFSAIPLQDN